MKCPGRELSQVERGIESFLPRQGFDTLNQGRIQREHGIRLVDLKVLGIDDKRRMVDFVVGINEDWYAVALRTEPPTQRAVDLERVLQAFVTDSLNCTITQMNRGENPAESKDLFEMEVKRVRGLFREADKLGKKAR
jgi:hypothetical protein